MIVYNKDSEFITCRGFFMAPFFIGEMVFEFIGSVISGLFQETLGYDRCSVTFRTPLSPAEVLEQLTLMVDGTDTDSSSNKILVGEISPEGVVISTRGIWSPNFHGALKSGGDGSILKGTFATGKGALVSLFIAVFALLGICLLALFTAWAGQMICITCMVVVLWMLSVGFVVKRHKRTTIPDLKSRIRTRLKIVPRPVEPLKEKVLYNSFSNRS